MRVLHVSQPVSEGVARWVGLLAADQVRRGWDVTVASPVGGHLADDVVAAGARHLAWDATRSPGRSIVREARSLARIVDELRPDVIHLHSSKAGLAGRLALRGSRPTIFQPHAWSFEAVSGAVGRASLLWERFGLRWAHAVVCVSEQERTMATTSGLRADRIRVIRNGIDLSRWSFADRNARSTARVRLGIDADAAVVVCVGRLARQKGQDLLIDAWGGVREATPSAVLYLVGDGPDREALQVLATQVPGVVFVGASSDVASWIAAADVVALPSRWEGLALTALEAAASGRPLVASSVSGMAEVIGEGDSAGGVVVDVRDEQRFSSELSAQLTERLNDRSLAEREGIAGRRRVVDSFALQRALDETADLTTSISCADAPAANARELLG